MKYNYSIMSEKEIIALAQNNDNQALSYLLKKYDGYIHKMAAPYCGSVPKEEAVCACQTGLWEAIRDYDLTLDTPLGCYARTKMQDELNRSVKDNCFFTASKHGIDFGRAIRDAERTFVSMYEYMPSDRELFEFMRLEDKDFAYFQACRANTRWNVISIDACRDDEDEDYSNRMEAAMTEGYEVAYGSYDPLADKLEEYSSSLPDSYRVAVMSKYGVGCDKLSVRELARGEGVSEEAIRQRRHKGEKMLREYLEQAA